MSNTKQGPPALRPAGYAALVERFKLDVMPLWHSSTVASSMTHHVNIRGATTEEVFPARYWPGESIGDHLEFALKYDGTNLALLDSLFAVVDEKDIVDYITSKPTSKYTRRVWFLYEFLTGKTLDIDDLKQGNYVDLLEADEYYTISVANQVRRQRINNNLAGDRRFCPTVRRTKSLREHEAADLPDRCRRVVATYPPETLKRALSYLYTKETKSSYEIEHIKPTSSRMERFIAMLRLAEQEDFCNKQKLIELQNKIVDPRFRDSDYRKNQNYVGEAVAWQQERIHYVSPKSEDITDLMDGLIASHRCMINSDLSAVVHAAMVAYGFVFLHPFEDGNGRIHRFLIHNVLAQRDFAPEGIMFPVSASMLKNPAEYDDSLEAFSRHLLPLIEYTLDAEGRMTVLNDSARWYRYMDMTTQAEALYRFIERTIDTELATELEFMANYDKTKEAIQGIVDMPDRKIDLFIKSCLQNNGRLSSRKRTTHFESLSDDEISRMEQVVMLSYTTTPK